MADTATAVEWVEGSSAVCMARITDRPTSPTAEGTALLPTNVSSVVQRVWDVSDVTSPLIVGSTGTTLTTTDVIKTTLEGWHLDTTGHNFRTTVSSTFFAVGNRPYRVTFKVTHTDARIGEVIFEGVTYPVGTSSS